MRFTHYFLGRKTAGTVVEVGLSGSRANVRLLDDTNFNRYRRRRPHHYYGGWTTRSPIRLKIPHNGHWHVTIDLGGYRGRVRSSVRTLPGPPSPSRLESPAAPAQPAQRAHTPDTMADAGPACWAYDVFISHTAEDKETFVRPLACALQRCGLRVCYDELELRLGDSLLGKINHGLANSRFGVVVLSPSFLAKNWPAHELDKLATLEMAGYQNVLPIWHNISQDEIARFSPSFREKTAHRTSRLTVQEIADEIAALFGSWIGKTP